MVYALLEPMAVHVETKIRSRMKIYPVLAGELQEALLDMLEEYSNARKEKEQERKRQRDQRRLQGAAPEQDASPAAQEHQERDEDAVHGRQRKEGGVVVEAGHAELPQVAHVRAAGRQRRGPDDGVRLLRVSG